ncbi:glycoside hydrolase family 16 protein [Amnibacterium kyonggiense]
MAVPLYVQFVNSSGIQQRIPASTPARGLDLKYDETFARPLSATRTGAGATYASGKPNSFGVNDFGAAIFAQPDGSGSTASTMPGGYLRIPARPLPSSKSDPAGYGRTSTGGLLSSAHMGGSGFSAQYGYFEIRALGPAGVGTWSAFWLLSSGSLVGGGPTAEVDAAELYGDAPSTVFQAAHSWTDRGDTLGRSLAPAVPGGGDWALSWHTYGARVTPNGVDLYVDGVHTGHTARVVGTGQPFFFLVDLALTDAWQDASVATGRRSDLYVDSIRVWV